MLALLTQLVASKARVFAGTLFSTFTALIHRLRGFAGQDSGFLYCYNDFLSPLVRFERCEFLPVDEGPFSWNRVRYPISPDAYSWFREWPESFDGGRIAVWRRNLPAGRLEFLAGGAAVHGSTIRYMENESGQRVIGDWTDGAEFVTWELPEAACGNYSVEIRYACPDEFAGSRYRVGIEGAGELEGRVWNTGGWTSLSPWLPLGRLCVPAGRGRLTVRVTEKASGAMMNLSGVRLVSVERGAS